MQNAKYTLLATLILVLLAGCGLPAPSGSSGQQPAPPGAATAQPCSTARPGSTTPGTGSTSTLPSGTATARPGSTTPGTSSTSTPPSGTATARPCSAVANTGGTNPGGTNPGGTNPGGTNPGGTNPGGTNPGGTNPGGTNPGGTNPGGTNPGGTNPGGTNPGGTNPGGTNPGGTNPGGTNPGGTNPGGTNPGGTNPGGTNPGGSNPGGGNTPPSASPGSIASNGTVSGQGSVPGSQEVLTSFVPGRTNLAYVKVQNSTTIIFLMPDGTKLPIIIGPETDLSGLHGELPQVNEPVYVEAKTDAQDNLVATKLDKPQHDNKKEEKFHGVTTSAVGPDGKLTFEVGKQTFSFSITHDTEMADFHNNMQSIGNSMPVEVEVEVKHGNDQVTDVDPLQPAQLTQTA